MTSGMRKVCGWRDLRRDFNLTERSITHIARAYYAYRTEDYAHSTVSYGHRWIILKDLGRCEPVRPVRNDRIGEYAKEFRASRGIDYACERRNMGCVECKFDACAESRRDPGGKGLLSGVEG